MRLKFDWLIVLENLRRGIMVTDVTLEGPAGPRIVYVNSAWIKMTGYGRRGSRRRRPSANDGQHLCPEGPGFLGFPGIGGAETNAGDTGAAFVFLVDPFDGVGRAHAAAMRGRQAENGQPLLQGRARVRIGRGVRGRPDGG